METSLTGLHLRSERLRSQSLTVPSSVRGCPPRPGKESLLAEARFHRDAFASLGAPAREHRCSALCLHPRTKTVLFRTLTPVRLKCALGHEKSLLLVGSMALGQTKSINDAGQRGKRGGDGCDDRGTALRSERPGSGLTKLPVQQSSFKFFGRHCRT